MQSNNENVKQQASGLKVKTNIKASNGSSSSGSGGTGGTRKVLV